MFGMFNPFKRVSISKLISDQRYEAERGAIDHRASAEHHKALADMYDARLKRIGHDHPNTDDTPLPKLHRVI